MRCRQSHTVHTLQYWQTSSTQYSVKCVDTETGLIVGMALWDVYLTSSDWKKGEVSWLEGEEKERADALISPLWTAREHFWRDEKYLYCHVIAVHPDHQRKGIGELLFNFGRSIAEQTRLPIYIESSREAERLYYKMGCHVLRHRPVHKAEDLWPEKTNGAGEDCDVALFVWVPDNKVMKLPEKVVLA